MCCAVEILDSRDPAIQFYITENNVENNLKDLLVKIDGFKFQITVKVTFCKGIENDETIYSPRIYFKTQIVVSDPGIDDSLTTSIKQFCHEFKIEFMKVLVG